MIIAGMTALMHDNDSKVEQLESQNWFQRMVRTVTGKNKATREEIRRNHDKLNAYMSEALSALYNMNLIDEQIIFSLDMQISKLYVYNAQLRQMLVGFAVKLNEKIESVDNFHMLMEEISQGVYSSGRPLAEICKVISQLDHRTLSDSRKLDIVRRGLVSNGVLSDEQIGLKDYLLQAVEIPADDAGRIYLELGTIRDNFVADIILGMMDSYYFLPDMARKMKSKPAMIADVIAARRLDESITLSVSEIYDDFINSKINAMNGLVPVEAVVRSVAFDENTTYPEEIRRAAEAGIPEAQKQLGNIYSDDENYEQAVYWWRKAAEQGYSKAQYNMGHAYLKGWYVGQDYAKAAEWYRKAAEQGHADAQYRLGLMYDTGWGATEDWEEAAKWYRKAAEQGHADAQYNLGIMYKVGWGVPQDWEEAAKWYRKAAEQGHAKARYILGEKTYHYGEGVAIDYAKAREWYSKAADQGHEEAKKALRNL